MSIYFCPECGRHTTQTDSALFEFCEEDGIIEITERWDGAGWAPIPLPGRWRWEFPGDTPVEGVWKEEDGPAFIECYGEEEVYIWWAGESWCHAGRFYPIDDAARAVYREPA